VIEATPVHRRDAAGLVRVVDTDAHEGPVYVADEDVLYFTSVRRDSVTIKRLALDGRRFPLEPARVSVVAADANMANGMALGGDGRLVVCEQGTYSRPAAIAAIDPATGRREVLVDSFEGEPLNSPNDVVVKSDGTVWFTDPSYGHLQGFRPEPRLPDRVYRHDPRTGETSAVASSFDKPNGLAFSPDESVLYVGDNGAPQELKAYDVVDGRGLAGERVIATFGPEHPDGLKVDAGGRVYASSPSGVRVLDPVGRPLAQIDLRGAVNFAFAGPGSDVLFITADDAIWAAHIDSTTLKGALRWQL
jgi:gluconolactonase